MVKKQRWLLSIFIFLLLSISGLLIWGLTPLGPTDIAQVALQSDASVSIKQGKIVEFIPQLAKPQAGLIIYPGGRVDWRSYAPLARAIADKGYYVTIVPMPLSLAVLAPDSATEVIAAHPEITAWGIGGHSLGGAMAANYAYNHPGAVKGLVLWAAYPASSNNLTSSGLKVVSIYASQDGLATKEKIDASRSLLPANTRWVVIQGGNHAQFGSYGLQPGDGTATISPSEQMVQIVNATVDLLMEIRE